MLLLLKRYAPLSLLILFCLPCFGSEVFHLVNGFDIKAISHQQDHGNWILQTSTGSLELPLSEVAEIEVERDGQNSIGPSSATLPSSSPDEAIKGAAADEGLPLEFLRSVASAESGYDQRARSPKGAVGLMQLMPSTAKSLGVSPDVLTENAEGGAKYLRELLIRYRGDAVLALAAYNAGPGAVKKYRGVPPYTETRAYVRRVLRDYARQQKAQSLHTEPANPSLNVARSAVNKPSATN